MTVLIPAVIDHRVPRGRHICTENVYPPIPIRSYDWSACDDSYDGAEDSGPQAVGWSDTEYGAVLNFYWEWEEMYDETYIGHRPGFEEDLYCIGTFGGVLYKLGGW